jgi:hypothetical protein
MSKIPLTGLLEGVLNLGEISSEEELNEKLEELEGLSYEDKEEIKSLVDSYEEIEE